MRGNPHVRVHCGQTWWDLGTPVPLSSSIDLRSTQPNAFGLPKAATAPFQAEDFVASRAAGGSVNCFGLTLWPHGNGTHTEGPGHIHPDHQSVLSLITPQYLRCALLYIVPVALGETTEGYRGRSDPADVIVSRETLQRDWPDYEVDAAIVACFPPEISRNRNWTQTNPPYFTNEAMRWLRDRVQHLITDLPSVDREDDGALLSNHHIFWKMEDPSNTPRPATITELAIVPDLPTHEHYFARIEVSPVHTDAIPSRIWLYPATTVSE